MALKGGNFNLIVQHEQEFHEAKIDIDEEKDELSGQKKSKGNKEINNEIKIDCQIKFCEKKYDNFQEHIIQKINENSYSNDSLIEDLKYLIQNYPKVKKFTDQKFLSKKDLDIFNEGKKSELSLLLNATNIINVVNFLWNYSSKDISSFTHLLSKLNINFSYIKIEKNPRKICCVLMTSIPSILYNYISTNGYSELKNKKIKSFVKEYTLKDQSTESLEYCYQNTICLSLMEKIGFENNAISNPTIIYYLKPSISEKLIKLNIVIPQEEKYCVDQIGNYKAKEYIGYEKVDLCLTMKKNISFYQDYNFISLNGDVAKSIGKKILLKEGVTYVISIKLNIEDIINKIEEIENSEKKFIESFKNVVISNKKIFNIETYQLLFMTNNNLSVSSQKLKEKSNKKIIKKNIDNFIYSSPEIGLGMILNLQKSIKYISNKVYDLENEIDKKNNEIEKMRTLNEEKAKNLEKKIEEKDNEIESIKALNKNLIENNYNQSIINLKLTFAQDISKIINEISSNNFSNFDRLLPFFNNFSSIANYYKLFKKDSLCNKIFTFVDKDLESNEGRQQFEKIKKLILQKANANAMSSFYYQSLMDLLFSSNKKKEINYKGFSEYKPEDKSHVEDMITYVEILENNSTIENIESKYQAALLIHGYNFLGKEQFLKIINYKMDLQAICRNLILCEKI